MTHFCHEVKRVSHSRWVISVFFTTCSCLIWFSCSACAVFPLWQCSSIRAFQSTPGKQRGALHIHCVICLSAFNTSRLVALALSSFWVIEPWCHNPKIHCGIFVRESSVCDEKDGNCERLYTGVHIHFPNAFLTSRFFTSSSEYFTSALTANFVVVLSLERDK